MASHRASPTAVLRSRALLSALLCLSVGSQVSAQDGPTPGDPPDRWTVEGEVGASVFFGNTEQTTIATRAGVERADSTWEVSTDAGYSYGEATDADGVSFVSKRVWRAGAQVDYRPFDRWSPFLFTNAESSLEQRVDLRVDAGAGGKYTWVRTDDTRVDLSVAVLGERLDPREVEGGPVVETETLARWSTRFRARHTLAGGRVAVSTVNFYQPRIDRLDSFTLNSESSLAFQLTDVVSVKLTFLDTYDSEAEARGARTNNDGQIFFSVLGSF